MDSIFVSEETVFSVLNQETCMLDENKRNLFLISASVKILHDYHEDLSEALTLACLVRSDANDILDLLSSSAIQILFDKSFYPALLKPVFAEIHFGSEFFLSDIIMEQLGLDETGEFKIEQVIIRCYVLNLLKKKLPSDVYIISNDTLAKTTADRRPEVILILIVSITIGVLLVISILI
ncbi:hypothetical protein HZS_3870, partial [Henneguya salminicola]